MATVSGMYITSVFDVARIDDASYRKGVRTALEKLMRRAAKVWLLEIAARIPYRTGFLLGAFGNLEDSLGIQIEGKTNPLVAGVRKVQRRSAKTNTERVAALLKKKARLRQLEADLEKQKERLQIFRDEADITFGSKGRKRRDKARTTLERREEARSEGLREQNVSSAKKIPRPQGEDAEAQDTRFREARIRAEGARRLKALEHQRKILLERIRKAELRLIRKKSKANSKRSRGKLRGITRDLASKMALLAALSQLAQKRFKGVEPTFIPKANRRDVTGATTDRIKKIRKKKYKYVLTYEKRETETPNPEYTKLTQSERVRLSAKKQLPAKTIKTITDEPVHKRVFDRYVTKRVKVNEGKRSSHIDVFREYYYHTKGSKARVLKTPKTGAQFATPKEQIFQDIGNVGSEGQDINVGQSGQDVNATGKSYQFSGDTPFTPSKSLGAAKVAQKGRGKTVFSFNYSVDIKYWAIMDKYKSIARGNRTYSPRGTPWLALANANKKMLDFIQSELQKPGTIPTMFEYLVKSRSSVLVGKKSIIRGVS